MNTTRHVPALDGLRAVAVVMVILFHLDMPGFGSGFLGVDIFFVLSGFLITSLLVGEKDGNGRISLGQFWSRRIRRLMPALVVLLLVTSAVTALTATRSERESARGDLLSTTFYVANWHFIEASDYFNDTGTDSPLEHTWSLAIEEQFYFFWPISLVALLLIGKRRPRVPIVGAAAFAALSAVLLAAYWDPETVERAYMGTDSRVFEPLIGAVAALLMRRAAVRDLVSRRVAPIETVAVACMGLAAVVVLRNPDSYFNGGAILLSVATALLIAALWVAGGGGVRRILELRPVVWVGALSYGIYLWHWPFIVWFDVRSTHGIDVVQSIAVVILTVEASAVSYYLVERPIRSSRANVHLRVRRVALGAPVVLAAIAGISVLATQNPAPAVGTPVILITGDSVPKMLTPYLERAAENRGWVVLSAAKGGCPANGDNVVRDDGSLRLISRCSEVTQIQQAMVDRYRPTVVVRWDRFSLADWRTPDGHRVSFGTPEFWSRRRVSLGNDVARLGRRGAVVALVATEPLGVGVASRCTPQECTYWLRRQLDHYDDLTSRWNAILEQYARAHGDKAAFVSITDTICRRDTAPCDDRIDGKPARGDGAHYVGAGGELAANALLDELEPLMP